MTMSINELIEEYEAMMKIKLSLKEKVIFDYAYMVGKRNLDEKEID